MSSRAYTLVELLVVFTIIAALLALLMPVVDRAVYQAELAACGARLKGVAGGLTLYAADHRRRYPHRPGVYAFTWRLNAVAASPFNSGVFDDRATIAGYILPAALLDPLAPGGISLNVEDTDLRAGDVAEVWSSYALWFSFEYRAGSARSRGMLRAGDRLEWDSSRYSVLVGDHDLIDRTNQWGWGGHPDSAGMMFPRALMNEPEPVGSVPSGVGAGTAQRPRYVYSRWNMLPERGPLDMNFAYDDGSVRRWAGVEMEDERMGSAPDFSSGSMWPGRDASIPRE